MSLKLKNQCLYIFHEYVVYGVNLQGYLSMITIACQVSCEAKMLHRQEPKMKAGKLFLNLKKC